jgi:hypothetical protein
MYSLPLVPRVVFAMLSMVRGLRGTHTVCALLILHSSDVEASSGPGPPVPRTSPRAKACAC